MVENALTDEQARRFLAGDSAQVSEIRSEISRVVRAFRFPERDAEEDLVQETLARLVSSLREGRFRGESSLKTYAQNMAKYTCLEHRRRRLAVAPLDPETLPSEARWSRPDQSVLESEQHRRNLEAFASLPADCRELLLLINLDGLSYREVGKRLGLTEGAIKTRVRRLREAVRRFILRTPGQAVATRQSIGRARE